MTVILILICILGIGVALAVGNEVIRRVIGAGVAVVSLVALLLQLLS